MASQGVIHKHVLEITDQQTIKTFSGAHPLAFQVQDGKPCLWLLVDPEQRETNIDFFIYGTGHEVYETLVHLGTIQLDGFVWHLFY